MTKVWCIFEIDGDYKRLFSIRSSEAEAKAEVKEMGWREATYEIERWSVD